MRKSKRLTKVAISSLATDNGLGQLAIEGKQENTKLDPCGEFEFNMLTTCGIIKVTSDL